MPEKTLVRLLEEKERKKIKNEIEYEEISNNMKRILEELSRISQLGKEERVSLVRDLVSKHGKKTRNGQIILNSLAEYGFLYDEIIELENNN